MTVTDFITIILSIFFVARGAERGFMRSLLVPISLIIATIISIFYYQATKNLIVSLLIGLIGPILLHQLAKFLLKTFAQATNTDVGPHFLSSLGGVIVTLAWGWIFIVLTLILVAMFPVRGKPWTTLHDDVASSFSYQGAVAWIEKFLPASKKKPAEETNAPSQSEAQSLSQDPRFQAVLQDAEVQKEINAHDFAKLMQNPKVMALTQQIMNDPAMIKKLMSVYRNQPQQQQTTNP